MKIVTIFEHYKDIEKVINKEIVSYTEKGYILIDVKYCSTRYENCFSALLIFKKIESEDDE